MRKRNIRRKRSRNKKTEKATKTTKSSNKRIKHEKIKNSTTNQITNNFGKITIKN